MDGEELSLIEAELDDADRVLRALDDGIDAVRSLCEREPDREFMRECARAVERSSL